jgi:general secretion pathway protein B
MSYILEALKKSEQERGHEGAPGIQTIHTSSLHYRTTRKPLWPWLLVAILCVNLAVLLYFVFVRSNEAAVTRPVAVSTTPPTRVAPVVPQAVAQPAIAMPAPAPPVYTPPPYTPPPRVMPVQTTAVAPVPVPPQAPVIEVDELPPEIGSHVPRMEFSAHVYSSNPRQRSVVINDMFLEEGEMLSSDLKLSEITADGAIFEFRGYRFHRSVLAGWD